MIVHIVLYTHFINQSSKKTFQPFRLICFAVFVLAAFVCLVPHVRQNSYVLMFVNSFFPDFDNLCLSLCGVSLPHTLQYSITFLLISYLGLAGYSFARLIALFPYLGNALCTNHFFSNLFFA